MLKTLNKLVGVLLSLSLIFSAVIALGTTTVKADDDFKIDVAGTLIKYSGSDIDVVIPKNVKIIGEKAFASNKNIKSIKMSDKVTTIKAYAFDSCTNLKSIQFSKNITKIEDGAFYGCSSLEKVSLPNKLETIGNSILCNCTSLNGIYIPDSVKEIGAHAFGFIMLGGYTPVSDFSIVGDVVAKAYADKYNFSYTTVSSLKIKPVSLKKSNKTSAKLTWQKNAKIDKVQIQYSTKSNFSSKKTINVTGAEVTSKIITGLKKGQAYYVRIRGVKTIAGTTYNSAWSKTKRIVMA